MAESHGEVSAATEAEEELEASAAHDADRPPTADEERSAEQNTPDPEVAAHYEEANKIGAEVKGEGQID